MESRSFLESVQGYVNDPTKSIKLATIAADYTLTPTTAYVVFDGEPATSRLPLNVVRGYVPAAGDRVMLLPVGQTYVVAGRISGPNVPASSFTGWNSLGNADLLNSWAAYDDGLTFAPVRYRKNPQGRVNLSGLIKNGTAGDVFTLPVGYRNGSGLASMFTTVANGACALISIDGNGKVTWSGGGTNAYVSLDSVNFMSTDISESQWTSIGAAGAPAFTNSWTNFGGGWNTAGYYIDGYGVVHLRGLIAGGTASATAFTLPAGFRPPAGLNFAGAAVTTNMARIDISAGGAVVPVLATGGANTWISLDGIQFWAGGSGSYNGRRAFTFINSWANFGSGYDNAAFRVDPDGWVSYTGLIKSGTASSLINSAMTSELRPAYEYVFPAVATTGAARLDALPNGQIQENVYINGGTNGFVNLNNIGYYPPGI